MTHDGYLEPYRQAVQHHGADHFEATLWASPQTQRKRFEVFTQMIFLTGKRILDAGCGRGDLAAYLLEKQIHYAHYVGIDGLAEVIEFAQRRQLLRAEFIAGDFVREPALLQHAQPQVICISGSLNTLSDTQVMHVLETSWAATTQALIFNFLSDHAQPQAPQQTGPARRLNSLHLLSWAMRQTGDVHLRTDYFRHGHDATVLMNKSR